MINIKQLELEGPGILQAVGNGNPTDMKSFQQPRVQTYKGRYQLSVRSGRDPGKIVVHAKSPGLLTGTGRVLSRYSSFGPSVPPRL